VPVGRIARIVLFADQFDGARRALRKLAPCPGSDLDRLAQSSCPGSVSRPVTVAGDPGVASAVDAVARNADPTARYTIRVGF
jgi:hypothetical protein